MTNGDHIHASAKTMPMREPQTRVHQDERLAGEDPHRLRQEPEGRVVIVAEEGADRHERQHHRRQHEDEQIPSQRELLREQEGEQEADHHLHRHGHDDEDDRVVQPVPDVGVGENLGVVVEPDPGRRPRAIGLVAEEREPERPQKREDVHQKEERERRRHEEAADVFSPGVCDQRHGEKGGERGRSPEGNLRRQECNRQRHADHENDQRALPIVPAQRDHIVGRTERFEERQLSWSLARRIEAPLVSDEERSTTTFSWPGGAPR